MVDPADTRFFKAVQDVLTDIESADPHLLDAVTRAVATGAPLDFRRARESLDRLDSMEKDTILRQVHARMATDLSAIWDTMPGATRPRWSS